MACCFLLRPDEPRFGREAVLNWFRLITATSGRPFHAQIGVLWFRRRLSARAVWALRRLPDGDVEHDSEIGRHRKTNQWAARPAGRGSVGITARASGSQQCRCCKIQTMPSRVRLAIAMPEIHDIRALDIAVCSAPTVADCTKSWRANGTLRPNLLPGVAQDSTLLIEDNHLGNSH